MRCAADLEAGRVNRQADIPAGLARLQLGAQELQALRHQGFVSRERRGGCRVYRLRFRMEGRQVTRYVGTDAAQAAEVQQGLDLWQGKRRLERKLGRLAREAGRQLTRAKLQLTEPLARRGFGFHGRSVRRARSRHK